MTDIVSLQGTTWENATPFPITQVVRWDLKGSLDLPYMVYTAELSLPSPLPSLHTLTLTYKGNTLFQGRVMVQETQATAYGMRVYLEARSMGWLMVEQQAEPCTLWNVNLSTIFARTAGSVDFSLYSPNPTVKLPNFIVYQNMSKWKAFCTFCKQIGLIPYVQKGTVYCHKAIIKPPRITFSNRGQGTPYTEFRQEKKPQEIIERVYLQDKEGKYPTSLANPHIPQNQRGKVYYLSPYSEYVLTNETEGRMLLQQSMVKAVTYQVTTPKLFTQCLCDFVSVSHPQFPPQDYMITGWHYTWNQKGGSTTLHMVEPTFL